MVFSKEDSIFIKVCNFQKAIDPVNLCVNFRTKVGREEVWIMRKVRNTGSVERQKGSGS